jgi:recombination protein RecA
MAKKPTTAAAPQAYANEKDAKRAALMAAVKDIKKTYGEGAVMMMDDSSVRQIDVLSTGALTLDAALGIGGLPRGRVIEIYGPEGTGKSTLALHCVAEAQKAGGFAAYIDVENAMDANYASKIGVNLNETIIAQPESGEEAFEIAERLIRSNAVSIVVVDSVAALAPQQEIDGSMEDQQIGAQARLIGKGLRKLTAAIKSSNTVCIFINQLRSNMNPYGSPETQPGGKALKYYSSVRLDIRKADALKEGSTVIGNRVKVKVVKNKVAPPFKEAMFDIIFGKGIDAVGEILDLGVAQEIITKSGSFFYYKEERMGQGRDNAKAYLANDPEKTAEIEAQIRAALMSNKSAPIMDDDIDIDGFIEEE